MIESCQTLLFLCTIVLISTGHYVEESRGGRYENSLLIEPDSSSRQAFGAAVDLEANRAIVGAPPGFDEGVAYLYDASTGELLQTYRAADGSFQDAFGFSVSITGNAAVVGAPSDVVDGVRTGSAHIFDRQSGELIHQLLPPVGFEYSSFGRAVAASGNYALVGAPVVQTLGLGPAGSAYVFDLTTGQLVTTLKPGDSQDGDSFGGAVGLFGTTAVVGAVGHDGPGNASGAAYVFDILTGEQLHKLEPHELLPGDAFGKSVAIDGNRVIVGSPGRDELSQDDGRILSAVGAAYVFDVLSGDLVQKIVSPDSPAGALFGGSVGIDGVRAIVGGPFDGPPHIFDVQSGRQIARLPVFFTGNPLGKFVDISGRRVIFGVANSSSGLVLIFVPEPPTIWFSVFVVITFWPSLILRQSRPE